MKKENLNTAGKAVAKGREMEGGAMAKLKERWLDARGEAARALWLGLITPGQARELAAELAEAAERLQLGAAQKDGAEPNWRDLALAGASKADRLSRELLAAKEEAAALRQELKGLEERLLGRIRALEREMENTQGDLFNLELGLIRERGKALDKLVFGKEG